MTSTPQDQARMWIDKFAEWKHQMGEKGLIYLRLDTVEADELCDLLEQLSAPSETRPNIAPYPDLDTAKRDFTFGQLWVLGSQYADLLEQRAQPAAPCLKEHKAASADAVGERTPEEAAHHLSSDINCQVDKGKS